MKRKVLNDNTNLGADKRTMLDLYKVPTLIKKTIPKTERYSSVRKHIECLPDTVAKEIDEYLSISHGLQESLPLFLEEAKIKKEKIMAKRQTQAPDSLLFTFDTSLPILTQILSGTKRDYSFSDRKRRSGKTTNLIMIALAHWRIGSEARMRYYCTRPLFEVVFRDALILVQEHEEYKGVEKSYTSDYEKRTITLVNLDRTLVIIKFVTCRRYPSVTLNGSKFSADYIVYESVNTGFVRVRLPTTEIRSKPLKMAVPRGFRTNRERKTELEQLELPDRLETVEQDEQEEVEDEEIWTGEETEEVEVYAERRTSKRLREIEKTKNKAEEKCEYKKSKKTEEKTEKKVKRKKSR